MAYKIVILSGDSLSSGKMRLIEQYVRDNKNTIIVTSQSKEVTAETSYIKPKSEPS